MSAGYCSLETPAKSAAEYAHQLHKKAMILGLKFSVLFISFAVAVPIYANASSIWVYI
jgi:hypothetical protein